jgi:hypothetical protein
MMMLLHLGGSIDTVRKNREALVIASKEIDLEVNVVWTSECRTKYRHTGR